VALLEIDHVSKEFPGPGGPVPVFRDVAFSLERGEFLTVIGHSGCGKSTLLNIIAGLERPTRGGVVLDGREVAGPGLDRMVVFQSFALMPWLTVFDNVRLAVRAAHPDWPRRRVAQHVQHWLQTVGLGGAERKRPAQLSGGMRQRVGLARAFSIEPKVLLLDEPFAQIDALTRGVIQDELVRMWTAGHNTVFMVTHDVDEAILLSDRIALMTPGPAARLVEIVPVKLPRPRLRADLLDDPEYIRLRAHILRFLVEGGPTAAAPAPELARSSGRAPRLVRG